MIGGKHSIGTNKFSLILYLQFNLSRHEVKMTFESSNAFKYVFLFASFAVSYLFSTYVIKLLYAFIVSLWRSMDSQCHNVLYDFHNNTYTETLKNIDIRTHSISSRFGWPSFRILWKGLGCSTAETDWSWYVASSMLMLGARPPVWCLSFFCFSSNPFQCSSSRGCACVSCRKHHVYHVVISFQWLFYCRFIVLII